MKRIGLTQRVEFLPDIRERRDCLDQAWYALLNRLDLLPVPLPNCPGQAAALIGEYRLDGIILTGGNDLPGYDDARNVAPERDGFEQELIDFSRRCLVPILGVCRGFQLLNRVYGGTLVRVEHHVTCMHPVKAGGDSSIPLESRDRVNSFHRYGMRRENLSPELRAVASAPDGTIEAAVHRSLPQWGIMWHPERDPESAADGDLLGRLFMP